MFDDIVKKKIDEYKYITVLVCRKCGKDVEVYSNKKLDIIYRLEYICPRCKWKAKGWTTDGGSE